MWGLAMRSFHNIAAQRHAIRSLGLLGATLACAWGATPQSAGAGEVPAFAPGMIDHMQQMRRFEDADHGSQLTPPIIPRFAAEPDPTGAVATFQPKAATFTFN